MSGCLTKLTDIIFIQLKQVVDMLYVFTFAFQCVYACADYIYWSYSFYRLFCCPVGVMTLVSG